MNMNPESTEQLDDEMRPEYDSSGGVRGKYYEAYQRSRSVIVLDPDVAEIFGIQLQWTKRCDCLQKLQSLRHEESIQRGRDLWEASLYETVTGDRVTRPFAI